MTPLQLYCSAFHGTTHRCDGVCVHFDCIACYFWFVWDALQVLSSLCLKLVTEHPVLPWIFTRRLLKSGGPLIWRPPSLITLILPIAHCFIWVPLQRQPCLVYFIPTFGAIPTTIFQVCKIRCLIIILSWWYILSTDSRSKNMVISYWKMIWRGTQLDEFLRLCVVSVSGSINPCVAGLWCIIVFSQCAYVWPGKFLWSTLFFCELWYILSGCCKWNWGVTHFNTKIFDKLGLLLFLLFSLKFEL